MKHSMRRTFGKATRIDLLAAQAEREKQAIRDGIAATKLTQAMNLLSGVTSNDTASKLFAGLASEARSALSKLNATFNLRYGDEATKLLMSTEKNPYRPPKLILDSYDKSLSDFDLASQLKSQINYAIQQTLGVPNRFYSVRNAEASAQILRQAAERNENIARLRERYINTSKEREYEKSRAAFGSSFSTMDYVNQQIHNERQQMYQDLFDTADSERRRRSKASIHQRRQRLAARMAMMDESELEKREYRKKYGSAWQAVYNREKFEKRPLLELGKRIGVLNDKNLPKIIKHLDKLEKIPGIGRTVKFATQHPYMLGAAIATQIGRSIYNISKEQTDYAKTLKYYGGTSGAQDIAYMSQGLSAEDTAKRMGRRRASIAALQFDIGAWKRFEYAAMLGAKLPDDPINMTPEQEARWIATEAEKMSPGTKLLFLSSQNYDEKDLLAGQRLLKTQNASTTWGKSVEMMKGMGIAERYDYHAAELDRIKKEGGLSGGILNLLDLGGIWDIKPGTRLSGAVEATGGWLLDKLGVDTAVKNAAESLTSSGASVNGEVNTSSTGNIGFTIYSVNVDADNPQQFASGMMRAAGHYSDIGLSSVSNGVVA